MSPPAIDFIALQTWLAARSVAKAAARSRASAQETPEPRS